MILEILNLLTPKGKRSLTISIMAFVIHHLMTFFITLTLLSMLSGILTGQEFALSRYWLILGGCILIKGLSNIGADYQKHFAGFDVIYQLREKIVYRLKQFSLGFYTNERLGEINTIIKKDVDAMESVVGHVWSRMVADFVVSLILLVYLLFLDYRMTLLMLVTMPLALIMLYKELDKAKAIEEESGDATADMVSVFVEYVKGMPLLKAFSENTKFDLVLSDSIESLSRENQRSAKYRSRVLSKYIFMIDISYAIMVGVGIIWVVQGHLDLMHYLIFVLVSKEFYKPFVAMESHWMNYLKVTDSYNRIQKILSTPIVKTPEMPQLPKGYEIAFSHVAFNYEEDEFELSDVSFIVPENTLTALVGESGSGKTTITNLLLRFWDVRQGAITIGGVDIRSMAYDDLLDYVSIVMQSVQLFSDTIEENIRIGKKGASHDEIVAAAKKARIHDFIMTLPQGYDTLVGENGSNLSGGEKQRISIARAFLKNAPILILDEITSNVDPVNKVLIQEAVSALAKNRTVLVIAHQLGTIRSADQILVLKKGKVVEKGTHETLLANKGYYHTLIQS